MFFGKGGCFEALRVQGLGLGFQVLDFRVSRVLALKP